MGSLKYLLFRSIRNTMRQLIKSPAKLLVIIIYISLILLVFLAGGKGDQVLRNRRELNAIIFALYYLMFVICSMQGLNSGASFYSMADVNILFNTPISSKMILIYGLVKQMGKSLLIGLFIFFQYSWLHNSYGVNLGGLFAIFIGYCIVIFCSQLAAMTIYSCSSSNEKRQSIIRTMFVAFSFIIAVYAGLPVINAGDKLAAAVSGIDSGVFNMIPVAGWMKNAVCGTLDGSITAVLLGLTGVIIYVAVFIFFILKANADYYEDVLQATEVSFSAITARKEGKPAESATKNVKLGKTGIRRGSGAGVFLYKHSIEDRRSGSGLIRKMSLIPICITIGFAIIMREAGIIPAFSMSVYLHVFFITTGRWVRELTLPFVYMIPEKPFRKLIMVTAESIIKDAFEAVLTFLIVGMILKLSAADMLACILARIGFSFLFVSITFLAERAFGSLNIAVLNIILYILVAAAASAPGVIIGVICASVFNGGLALTFLVIFVWNLLASVLISYLCKDILSRAELNNK